MSESKRNGKSIKITQNDSSKKGVFSLFYPNCG